MPTCLIIAPFPLAVPRHGGQVRAASLADAMRLAGWQVETSGIFHADFFPPEEWGAHDIVLGDQALAERATGDMLFADLHVARAAAASGAVADKLRHLFRRLNPDVVQIEHPWDWLVLRAVLPTIGRRPRIVYSSHNIEWRSRPAFFKLGMQHAASDALVRATRALERVVARSADLVFAISDLEAEEISTDSGRPVVYVPAVSDLADPRRIAHNRFAHEARIEGISYAALMGSGYWPNVEGFFDLFPEGLGFLSFDERIWVAGNLGRSIQDDARYRDYLSLNETRLRAFGYVDDADKAAFFGPAACVLVPVRMGAGAKLKTADAVASGRPVIATPHAIEGYGPIVRDAVGHGVYLADTPREYRLLVRRALREGMPGCRTEVRARLSLERMSETVGNALSQLMNLDEAEARSSSTPPVQSCGLS